MSKKDKVPPLKKARKAYRKPALTNLGSVRQLTLKLGSLTDGQNPGRF